MSASSLGTFVLLKGGKPDCFRNARGGLLIFPFLPSCLFLATLTDRKPEQNEMKIVASKKCPLRAPWNTKVHSVTRR